MGACPHSSSDEWCISSSCAWQSENCWHLHRVHCCNVVRRTQIIVKTCKLSEEWKHSTSWGSRLHIFLIILNSSLPSRKPATKYAAAAYLVAGFLGAHQHLLPAKAHAVLAYTYTININTSNVLNPTSLRYTRILMYTRKCLSNHMILRLWNIHVCKRWTLVRVDDDSCWLGTKLMHNDSDFSY